MPNVHPACLYTCLFAFPRKEKQRYLPYLRCNASIGVILLALAAG